MGYQAGEGQPQSAGPRTCGGCMPLSRTRLPTCGRCGLLQEASLSVPHRYHMGALLCPLLPSQV